MKSKLILLLLVLGVNALKTPCYGYGQVMGTPSSFLKSDYKQLKQIQAGNISDPNQVFLKSLQFRLGNRNFITATYTSRIHANFSD